MLNLPERPSLRKDSQGLSPLPLGEWLSRVLEMPQDAVQVRLRGNSLYILCQGNPCPPQAQVRQQLIAAIAQSRFESLLPSDSPILHRVVVYGRALGDQKPRWADTLEISQIGELWAKQQPAQAPAQPPAQHAPRGKSSSRSAQVPPSPPAPWDLSPIPSQPPEPVSSAMPSSERVSVPPLRPKAAPQSLKSLAESGKPTAIAHYLSQHLSQYNIAVRVKAKPIATDRSPIPSALVTQRLWVMCESSYSVDASLIAEAIAQRLRELKLDQFQDAIVLGQVQGEAEPDWTLRVNLTPAQEMLRQWGQWGDAAALTQLLNQRVTYAQISLQVDQTTLHIHCAGHRAAPDQGLTVAAIEQVLSPLAPRGLHGASIYGLEAQASPQQATWVHWLELPAANQVDLAESANSLAQRGDLGAIAYLLTRRLNPDLAQYLATGGIHLQVRQRDSILHIMADSLHCPPQKPTVATLTQFFREVPVPGLTGLCFYGRRSGQSQPSWRRGVDLGAKLRVVPEATPDFAASDAYVGDLLSPPGALVWIPRKERQSWSQRWEKWSAVIQDGLIRSTLFSPVVTTQQLVPDKTVATDSRLALVWGLLGLCVAISADWSLGILSKSQPQDLGQSFARSQPELKTETVQLPSLSLNKSKSPTDSTFNASGFTQEGPGMITAAKTDPTLTRINPDLPAAPLQAKAIVDPKESPYPSLNAEQLDERLALYQQSVKRSGVPDVLIVGSSRALRGIDPTALQDALAQEGYPNVKVFNFGVNGATAQVVDLLLRRLIAPNQLPKLVIWADGARAFNSGRVDITYNAIAVSEGFKQLPPVALPAIAQSEAASPAPTDPEAASAAPKAHLKEAYQTFDKQLAEGLGRLSAAYDDRSTLLTALQTRLLGGSQPSPTETSQDANQSLLIPSSGRGLIDINGFLPLSNQFNPTTYYQKYTRVSGTFDGDYESFQLPGKQEDALKAIVDYTKAKKVSLVFVNLPLTLEYLDVHRREYEETFQQYMTEKATAWGFTYRNLAYQWKTKNDLFSDPSHLNRYGAYVVSQAIARDALIPWSKKAPSQRPSGGATSGGVTSNVQSNPRSGTGESPSGLSSNLDR
ncbi:hypothetical protein [Alkalinema sp. FACHB-956]|uniref:hypothetical protein n=1 Tax=Alkalinema sp. FACHB-956 TaxID=2692768 RepID=UPI00168777AA|nr:hypothetical protein [Alkalinema sp. FACHB-956]MBD2325361.1 hypothetical protein [Alkalinema sp. FACHB-956]